MYTDFQSSQLDTTVRGWGGRRGERKMEEWEMGGKEGEKEGGMRDGRRVVGRRRFHGVGVGVGVGVGEGE